MKTQPAKKCRVCNAIFSKPSNISHAMWKIRETCSKACGATHKNPHGTYSVMTKTCKQCGKTFAKKLKDTYTFFERQRYCSIACGKIGKRKGEENNKWLGDYVTYVGLHAWMRKNYGTPSVCEHCKCRDRKMYHWANVSGKYLRDRNDWIRLCVPCHKKYDKTKLSTSVPQ